MADTILLDAVSRLREENIQSSDELIVGQMKTNDNLSDLNEKVGDFLQQFKNSRLDAEEARRDKSRGSSPAAADTRPDAPDDDDFGLKGILQVVAGIAAGVTGFLVGLGSALAGIYGKIFKSIGKFLKVDVLIKDIVRISKSIGTFFKGLGTNALAKIKNLRNAIGFLFSTRFPQITDKILDIGKSFKNVGKGLTTSFTNIKNAFTAGTNGVNGVARSANGAFRRLNVIEKIFNTWGKTVGKVGDDAKKLFSVVKTSFSNAIQPIKNIINGIRGVGQSTSTFGKTLKTIFAGFKVIGRFIAFPLTVIMSIIDAFKGMREGAERQIGTVDKIIGGFVGAIGGLVKSLVGMPLDLLKSAVSWIAGKLGFEDAEKYLDSFKFVDIIGDIFNGIADFFVDMGNRVKIFFNKIGGNLLEPIKKLWNGEGSVLTNIKDILTGFISTVVGFPLDLIKGVVSSVLKLFGVKNNLDEFSFMDSIKQGYDAIFSWISGIGVAIYDFFASLGIRIFSSLKERFEGILTPITNLFNGRGSFLDNAYELVKNIFTSIVTFPYDLLKDLASSVLDMLGFEDASASLDSFSFNEVFGKVIDWVTGLPGRLVEGLMSIFNGETDVTTLLSDAMSGAMDMATQFNNWLKGLVQPYLSGIAKDDSWLGKLGSFVVPDAAFEWAGVDPNTGKVTQVSSPDITPRSTQTDQMNQTQKETEDMKAQQSSSANVVVDSSSRNVTNNSSTTAAVIDQNLPTVDNNDRSWGFGW
jgi:hypothetical protein